MTVEARAPAAVRFAERIGVDVLDLRTVVLELSRVPYGRVGSPEAVVDSWRGTCSTKHVLLAVLASACEPARTVRLWHRPYVVTRDLALERWGSDVADVVPDRGLVDVHTFATVGVDGRAVRVDVTFSIDAWDGTSDLPLACGDGPDIAAGPDALASKAVLVGRHCDPSLREPFIAALSR